MKVYRVLTSGSHTELPPEGPSLVNWTQNYYYKYTHKNYTYDNCQNIKSNVLPPVSSKKNDALIWYIFLNKIDPFF